MEDFTILCFTIWLQSQIRNFSLLFSKEETWKASYFNLFYNDVIKIGSKWPRYSIGISRRPVFFLYHLMLGVRKKLAKFLATEWDTRAILDFLTFLSKFIIRGQSRLKTTKILDYCNKLPMFFWGKYSENRDN